MARAGGVAVLPPFSRPMGDPDADLRGASLEAIVVLPAAEVTPALQPNSKALQRI